MGTRTRGTKGAKERPDGANEAGGADTPARGAPALPDGAADRAGAAPSASGTRRAPRRTEAPVARVTGHIAFPGARLSYTETDGRAIQALKAAWNTPTPSTTPPAGPATTPDAPESRESRESSEPVNIPIHEGREPGNIPVRRMRAPLAGDTGHRRLIAVYQPEQPGARDHASDTDGGDGAGHEAETGVLVSVTGFEEQGEHAAQVTLDGVARVRAIAVTQGERYDIWVYEALRDGDDRSPRAQALTNQARRLFEKLAMLDRRFSPDDVAEAARVTPPGRLADHLAARVISDVERQSEILLALDPLDRLERVCVALGNEIEIRELENKIRQKVRQQVDKNQREYYLKEQLRAIQEELGADQLSEVRELRDRIARKGFPEEAHAKVLKEVDRLEHMPAHSAEVVVLRNYIDWMLALPWSERSDDRLDMTFAQKTLDDEHYGLEKVKERIVEFLAVRQLRIQNAQREARATASDPTAAETAALAASATAHKGPILCLIGPPGVGKTSLGRSIAHALGRTFVRISLGGVHDEAEIRGHRRTYVGALPGRILQAMRTAGTVNPVFLLDEIDKLGADYRGDPSAALLEALDPEQNRAFSDHYLETPYDLSQCFFICTGNSRHQIPRPLADRMDIIELPGYTEEEKIEIGRRFVLPKTLDEHGLSAAQLQVPVKTMRAIISGYTREAGVRSLERQLATICRKAARRIVTHPETRLRVSEKNLDQFLGAPHYLPEKALESGQVGVATGLAWTSVGGALLPVEVLTMPGKGSVQFTGQLGDVMQESARAALSYIRSRAEDLDLPEEFPGDMDIHIHLPEGAIPKDGPSAGITMALAMVSALTRRPVRGDIAMTGEITLRGRVLAIGGLKEKALAAVRAGIHHLIIPAENSKDLAEIPAKIRASITFTLAPTMDDVIRVALMERADTPPAAPAALADDEGEPATPAAPDLEGEAAAPPPQAPPDQPGPSVGA